MKLNVCVAGATGWVGKPLCTALGDSADLMLVGAVSRSHRGQQLGDILGNSKINVTVRGSVAEALDTQTDVLVDYTRADVVKANVMTAIGKGVHVVIGSSGLTEPDLVEIGSAALRNHVGVIAAGNFALTAILLERFACEAARYFPHWEIVDYASDNKVDAPSGTARELAYKLSEVGNPGLSHPIENTIGPRESRGTTLHGTQIHSIRLPSYAISVEITFGATDERLSIRYDGGSGASPYIQGTLLAIRTVRNHVGLIRGLDKLTK